MAGAQAFSSLQGFVPSARVLLSNASYLALSVAKASEIFVMAGLVTFMPKIVERQFSMTSSSASMLLGNLHVFLYPGTFEK